MKPVVRSGALPGQQPEGAFFKGRSLKIGLMENCPRQVGAVPLAGTEVRAGEIGPEN